MSDPLSPRSPTSIRGAVPRRPEDPPRPPAGAHDVVVLVLDSCRFDSFAAAAPRQLERIGALERRWSYASWTSPSHFNLLMGLLPHRSEPGVLASTTYRREYRDWGQRLGVEDMGLLDLLPRLWLPHALRRMGYQTHARVSLPVLHPDCPLNQDFDSYALMPRHDRLDDMLAELRFDPERPSFWLLNAGETHYPYSTAAAPDPSLPRLSGVRGVLAEAQLRGGLALDGPDVAGLFSADELRALQARQVQAVVELEPSFERLLDLLPTGAWLVVTADHGELFGEEGYFGHGPFQHQKLFEVPFLEGRKR